MMRKFTLLLLFLVISATMAMSQGIPNSTFEIWSITKMYDEPQFFNTGNATHYMLMNESNVSRSNDAHSGSYSLKLETKMFLFFPFPALVSTGSLDDMTSGGIPFADQPDSFIANLKYELNQDTAFIIIYFKKDGSVLTTNVFPVFGDQTSWKEFRFPLLPLGSNPDTVIIAFTSGQPESFTLTEGSYLMVDNISFTSVSTMIPNNSFELWNEVKSEDAEGWSSFNPYLSLFGLPPSVTKSTDAHNGIYSISVKTIDAAIFGGDLDTFGIALTGMIEEDGFGGGFALNSKPDSMSFYYKYNNSNNVMDMAIVGVFFSKFNTSNMQSETIDSFFWLLPAAFTWTRKSVSFTDTLAPDTANIVISSSNLLFDIKGVGNEILVDDMLFYFGGVGIPVQKVLSGTVVYPNPSSSVSHIDFTLQESLSVPVTVEIYNANGQLIQQFNTGIQTQGQHHFSFSTTELSSGSYILHLSSGKKNAFTTKLQVLR